MLLLVVIGLFFVSFAILVYQLLRKPMLEAVNLPSDIKGAGGQSQGFDSRKILNFTARFTDPLVKKSDVSLLEKMKFRLSLVGTFLNVSQFFALKFICAIGMPFVAVFAMEKLGMPVQPPLLLIVVAIGFILPDMWLNGQVKKKKLEILRDLPYIIDLLNICVGAGLDFMMAVNHVITDFRPCLMVNELRAVSKEMQMGVSRRDALKNMARRLDSPEVNSFVRTLLQADRMGTPITTALRMHSEELRSIRFQRGEEMALKAPIKLLFPLLVFILPVVMIIVAGPILIQFTQGGMMKF
ncbi:MAG: type II secretion system F family protein [Deltaproteobacteria bacterium]